MPCLLSRARQAVELALEAAVERGHEKLEAEDLLVGILRQGANFAVHVVETLGVSPDDVLLRVNDVSPVGTARHHNDPLDYALSDDTRGIFSLAARQAVSTHPDHPYIGNEELLYALAGTPDTLAAQVLGEFGIGADAVARAIRTHIQTWMHTDRTDLLAGQADGDDDE